ncbi:uncharacterized protein CLUP02_16805 [Colletotrichum lupini]|uniref:Uncharacterized protein n=1 Tax=Colletotrichum lupini TaxID=145971 RepID=A0A9Q8TAU4_9PEZI|nr:uncharacterized protein CLUP02_16805 [Colletotrichum lupini]UQC91271.1 hypothetical protein CLUP02_16805 [Colletotrichum lupini]
MKLPGFEGHLHPTGGGGGIGGMTLPEAHPFLGDHRAVWRLGCNYPEFGVDEVGHLVVLMVVGEDTLDGIASQPWCSEEFEAAEKGAQRKRSKTFTCGGLPKCRDVYMGSTLGGLEANDWQIPAPPPFRPLTLSSLTQPQHLQTSHPPSKLTDINSQVSTQSSSDFVSPPPRLRVGNGCSCVQCGNTPNLYRDYLPIPSAIWLELSTGEACQTETRRSRGPDHIAVRAVWLWEMIQFITLWQIRIDVFVNPIPSLTVGMWISSNKAMPTMLCIKLLNACVRLLADVSHYHSHFVATAPADTPKSPSPTGCPQSLRTAPFLDSREITPLSGALRISSVPTVPSAWIRFQDDDTTSPPTLFSLPAGYLGFLIFPTGSRCGPCVVVKLGTSCFQDRSLFFVSSSPSGTKVSQTSPRLDSKALFGMFSPPQRFIWSQTHTTRRMLLTPSPPYFGVSSKDVYGASFDLGLVLPYLVAISHRGPSLTPSRWPIVAGNSTQSLGAAVLRLE